MIMNGGCTSVQRKLVVSHFNTVKVLDGKDLTKTTKWPSGQAVEWYEICEAGFIHVFRGLNAITLTPSISEVVKTELGQYDCNLQPVGQPVPKACILNALQDNEIYPVSV